MPDNRNRKRPIQVKFFVDEKEQALIKKENGAIYEDNVAGRLDDERFAMMSKNYTDLLW